MKKTDCITMLVLVRVAMFHAMRDLREAKLAYDADPNNVTKEVLFERAVGRFLGAGEAYQAARRGAPDYALEALPYEDDESIWMGDELPPEKDWYTWRR